jgi:hypothetical protein
MRKLTPTLTQSGLLAVLLQHQRYKVIQLAWRRAHRKHVPAAFWSTLTWPWRALTAPTVVDDFAEPIVGALRRHTFLRVAPSGTAVHFDAKGIQRVYRCYSSRLRTARSSLMEHVLVPVIYFLVCLGISYLGSWFIVAVRSK